MADYILLGVILFFEFSIFYFLPVFNGKGTLFGLVLRDEDYLAEGLPIVGKYRRDLLAVFLISVAGFAFLIKFSAESLVFVYILSTTAILFLLFKYLRQSWRLRDKGIVGRLATSLKPRLLKDFSHFWLETCVVLLTVIPIVFLIYYYPQLPETVPIHWNASGEPDGWARKSFFSVFFAPMLAIWLQIFWLFLKRDIIQARFRVPAGDDAGRIFSLKEISLRANINLIDWCRLFGGVLFATVSLLFLSETIPADFPLSRALNVLLWTSVVLMLAGIGFSIYRIILVNREIKSIAGQVIFQTAVESEGWDAGGLYYYNPNDPAFMVEKPGGVGYTLNFAHRRTFIYLALVLSPMIFSFLGLTLMQK